MPGTSLPLLSILLLAPALASPPVLAQRGTATVVSIGDGDTIRVGDTGRLVTVRLACIDAPEMAQAPYGAQARRYLQTRLPIGSAVRLIPQTTDRYGRTVAEVIGEVNLNLALVEDGLAFAYRQYLAGCDAKEYLNAEHRASRRRYGVWQVPGGITRPWDFRRGRRTTQPSGAGAAGSSSQKPAPWANTTPAGGRRYRCREIGSYALAQELLRQGHTYLDGNGDGEACESLRP
ncbi:thermonuclease family protein [Vulcanococcus limneticus]|uniref:thermonuclease family protein n=1 Tax=Vulcanococcus limneticus TaxID=2170428 RepID=UPI00398BC03D